FFRFHNASTVCVARGTGRLALALKVGARDELRLDGKLLLGEAHGFARQLLIDRTADLAQEASGADEGDDTAHRVFPFPHAYFGRLLRDGFVREDADVDLAHALHAAGHGDTGSLDLAARDLAGLQRLDPIIPKSNPCTAFRIAFDAAFHLLAILGAL